MIPFAEFLNHENVNVQYDYIDHEGKSITCREDKKSEKRGEKLHDMLKKRLFLDDLKDEL